MKKHLLAAALVAIAAPAWADVATTTIDLKPLFNLVIWPMLSVIGLALAGFIATRISTWTGSQNEARNRALINDILQSGLQAAQARVATSNIQHIDVQDGIVAGALQYAVANGPDALKKAGVDVTTPEGRAAVSQKLEAMLAPAVMVAVSSPVDVSVATAATIANPAIPVGPAAPTITDAGAPVVAPAAGSIAQVTADAAPPTN